KSKKKVTSSSDSSASASAPVVSFQQEVDVTSLEDSPDDNTTILGGEAEHTPCSATSTSRNITPQLRRIAATRAEKLIVEYETSKSLVVKQLGRREVLRLEYSCP
ncbi:unnamed protein product, partial [Amoebophrya sp. A25]